MGDVGRPEFGGRFTLVRGPHEAERLHYDVMLMLPDAEWAGELSVALADGAVVREADWRRVNRRDTDEQRAEEPPGWLIEQVWAALRSAWRGWSKARQAGAEEPITAHFPRRVTRWRAEPEGKVEVAARRLAGPQAGEE